MNLENKVVGKKLSKEERKELYKKYLPLKEDTVREKSIMLGFESLATGGAFYE